MTQRIGERIRDLRIEAGLRQQDLAERLNVSIPAISNYENGVHQIDADDLPRFAEALGVKPAALLMDEQDIQRERLVTGLLDYFRDLLLGPDKATAFLPNGAERDGAHGAAREGNYERETSTPARHRLGPFATQLAGVA